MNVCCCCKTRKAEDEEKRCCRTSGSSLGRDGHARALSIQVLAVCQKVNIRDSNHSSDIKPLSQGTGTGGINQDVDEQQISRRTRRKNILRTTTRARSSGCRNSKHDLVDTICTKHILRSVQNLEQVLQNMNTLNRSLESVIAVRSSYYL